MFRAVALSLLFLLPPVTLSHADGDKGKEWALYTWIDDAGKWSYSLVRCTEQHPDGDQVKTSATHSLEAIKTRMALLQRGSSIQINPLPVLNMELQLPASNTIKEFDRVCAAAQLKLIR